MKDLKTLIHEFVEAYGPSGSEQQIREMIAAEVKPYVDEIKVDSIGNLIAIKHGGPQRIMFAAHMDEIGVMVTHIDDQGFLRFSTIGGLAPWTLLANRAVFQNGTVGVFGAEKVDSIKDLTFDKMFIDIGCESREEALKHVKVGDAAGVKREFTDLGNRLVSKAMDNRASCAVLVDALRQIKSSVYEIYAVFTTQEEVGLRGARVAAFGVHPDLGIAVDVTRTGDTPKGITMDVELGKGPTVKVRDSSVLCTPAVRKHMEAAAEANNIAYQLEVLEAGGTDAGAIQMTAEGIPAGVMSIPTRYIHSPSEMVDFRDCENGAKLIAAIVARPFSL